MTSSRADRCNLVPLLVALALSLLVLEVEVSAYNPVCWDSQFQPDKCCFNPDMFPICFQGQADMFAECCAGYAVELAYQQASPLTSCSLFQQRRQTASEILSTFHSVHGLCEHTRRLVMSQERPVHMVVASREEVLLFRNYIAVLAEMQQWGPMLVVTLDSETWSVCQALSEEVPLSMLCIAPRVCLGPDGQPMPRCPLPVSLSNRTTLRSMFTHVAQWYRPALLQLALDLGAAAAMYTDIDVVLRAPIRDHFFSPTMGRVQAMCEGKSMPGEREGGPRLDDFHFQGGLAYASAAAIPVLERWLRGWDVVYAEGVFSGQFSDEVGAIRDSREDYVCLGSTIFVALQLNEQELLRERQAHLQNLKHRAGEDAVAVHVAVPGKYKQTILEQLGLWKLSTS